VTDRTKQRLKTYGRRAYFAALVVAAAIVTWDAAVGARHDAPSTSPRAIRGHELSCAMPNSTDRKLEMLGQLPEASGLALSRRSPGLLWSMNDSGDTTLYALSTTGELRGRVRVTGATIRDWEDVSTGSCPGGSCVYLADIGDDGAKRMQVTIYRVPEPKAEDSATARAEAFVFDYPDKAHDAEAAFVLPDQTLFVITKGHPTVLYRAPRDAQPGTSATLTKVAELPVDQFLADEDRKRSRITDAETTPDGAWVALRTNAELLLVRTRDLVAGKLDDVWHFDLRPFDETQGEGVAISNGGDVYLAGEGGGHGLPGTFTHMKCQLPAS
jgi:hypothetical protein